MCTSKLAIKSTVNRLSLYLTLFFFFVSEKNLSYPNWEVVGNKNINHDFYFQLNLVLHFFKCIAKTGT